MSRIKSDPGLKPSILDRLIDPKSSGTAWRPGYGLQQTIDVIRRDLEDLLNTRQTNTGPRALQHSIYAYGLPDLSTFSAVTEEQRMAIGKVLEKTVSSFEPRLRDITVELAPSENKEDRSIAFRIAARLAVEPYDDVMFQTVLELTTGRYSVQQT